MKRKFFTLIAMVVCATAITTIQAQFHIGLDYRFSLGFSETVSDLRIKDPNAKPFPGGNISTYVQREPGELKTFYRDEANMQVHALMLSANYDITPQVSVGVGAMISLSVPKHFQTPFYATAKYRPIKKHLNAYVFTNLGYAPSYGGDTFCEGWLFDVGIGYSIMLRKHFGFNFQISYNLNHYKNETVNVDYLIEYETFSGIDIVPYYINSLRHSLGFTVGFIF